MCLIVSRRQLPQSLGKSDRTYYNSQTNPIFVSDYVVLTSGKNFVLHHGHVTVAQIVSLDGFYLRGITLGQYP